MRALAFAIAGALLCAFPAQAGEWDIEAFGGRSWSGNISAGGETNPAEKRTLERVGEYAFGGGFGYNTDTGWRYGGRIRYWSSGCNEHASADCVDLFHGTEVETRQIGVLGTIEYTFDTPIIVDPFLGLEMGLGYLAFDCAGWDSCPTGQKPDGNFGDVGFMYGFCGGLRLPVTDDYRWTVTTAACHHRTEGINPSGVPHWDAPSETTGELRVSRRF